MTNPLGVVSFLINIETNTGINILSLLKMLVHITFSLLAKVVSSHALLIITKQSLVDPTQWTKTLSLYLTFAQHSSCSYMFIFSSFLEVDKRFLFFSIPLKAQWGKAELKFQPLTNPQMVSVHTVF